MKKMLFLILLLASLNCSAKDKRHYTISFDRSEFSISKDDSNIVSIRSRKHRLIYLPDSLSINLPVVGIDFLIRADEKFESVSVSSQDKIICEGVNIINVEQRGQSSLYDFNADPVRYSCERSIDGYCIISFIVCPFRYDNERKELFLRETIDIDIVYANDNSKEIRNYHCGLMTDDIRRMVINGDEMEEFYGNENSMLRTNNEPQYDYLIVTCDSLKPVFQRLANWKTMKGIRAKVITVEYIDTCSYFNGTTRLERIKDALQDYYYDHGLKYVLLGGDVNIIPALICRAYFGSSHFDIPTDWYYSSRYEWDSNHNGVYGEIADINEEILSFSFIVSRVPAQDVNETEIFVNRIIEYEQSPKFGSCSNKVLMCGSKMTYDGDAECSGDYIAGGSLGTYWNGEIIKFYDSYTDLGNNYIYSPENLQTELQKGYTLVNVTSHGEVNSWKMDESCYDYTSENAWELNNNGSTIIITEACYTNHFNDTIYTDCLSEAFMRNPNSGVLGYIGSSVYGYRGDGFCPTGRSIDFTYNLYFDLLYNLYSLPKSVAISKSLFYGLEIDNISRVLIMGLNPIGDPEMPIYISTPLELTQTQVSLNNGNLTINTGDNDCRVCVMSYDDFGETYYNVQTVNGSITLPDIQQTVSVCITKPGYLPKTYIIGGTIYIQNETFHNKTNVHGNNVFIGRDVTNQKPEGEVVVIKNSTKVKSPGGTTITRDFEVKPGAEFEISVEQ